MTRRRPTRTSATSLATSSGGASAKRRCARAEGEATGQGTIATHVEAALEVGQVHLHGNALVVEDDLAILDDQAIETDGTSRGPGAAAHGRQVVTAFLEGVDAHARRLEADLAHGEPPLEDLGEARHHHHSRDLEERRRGGVGAGDAQAVDLRRERPDVQRHLAHGGLALEEVGECAGEKRTREGHTEANEGDEEDEPEHEEDQEPSARGHGHSRLPVLSGAYSRTTSNVPVSTVWPSRTATSRTRPARGARSSFSIFMASTTTRPWPCRTSSPGATRTRRTRPGMGAIRRAGPEAGLPRGGSLPRARLREVHRHHVVGEDDGEAGGSLLEARLVAAPVDEQAHEVAAASKVHSRGLARRRLTGVACRPCPTSTRSCGRRPSRRRACRPLTEPARAGLPQQAGPPPGRAGGPLRRAQGRGARLVARGRRVMAAAATATSTGRSRVAIRGREDLLHEGGVEVAGEERRVVQHALEEGQGGLDAQHLVLGDRAAHAQDRVLTAVAPDHELGEQGVVVDRHLVALVDAAVVAHAGPAGEPEGRDPAGAREEALVGILGVDPALDGVAALARSSWRKGSRSPRAMRICSFTRSTPVTISVTGCSTCRRVFISRK